MDRFEPVHEEDGVRQWRHRGNGLDVLCYPTPVAPVVSFGVVYRVGSRHELPGHTGATHLLEHLMFKGSRAYNRQLGTQVARQLQRVGAAYNATTWLDRTNYYESLPREHLGLAVAVEADRMRGALIQEEDFESERQVVLNELDQGENEAFELLLKASFAHAYLEHPYRYPTIGWRGDVERLNVEVLRSFYDTYYHPDNATVIIVGDFDEGDALALLDRSFGGIPPAGRPIPQTHAVESDQCGERRFVIRRAGELGCLALSWHIPRGLHPDLTALVVLTQILADGVTSRLHQSLVESNCCLGVHATAMELYDPGLFQISATLAPGVEHHEVESLIRDELDDLARKGPDLAELARAKIETRTDLAFHRESPAQILAALTECVAMGDWKKLIHEMEMVAKVGPEDISKVCARYLVDDNLTTGAFVPTAESGQGVETGDDRPAPCYLNRPFAERVRLSSLPGGARLAVLANPHAPTVTIAGTMIAGLACASDGRFTIPGMTPAMLERGTRRLDRMALASELEDHGLQIAAHASSSAPTTVSFSAQGLAEELPRLAELLIEVLRYPSFPAAELDKLRVQALGGLVREREETFPQAFSALCRHIYPPGHPQHRRPLSERESEVVGLTVADLESFHSRIYGPASMVLAVVGAVDEAEVLGLLSRLLEGWQGGLETAPPWPDPGAHGPATTLIPIADRPNLDVFLGHRSRLHFSDPDLPAAVLVNSCLGESMMTSRLGLALRENEGLSYAVFSRFFGAVHLPGPWATYLSVSAANFQRAVAGCRQVIESFVAEGPRPDELAEERTATAGSYRVGLATNAGVARELVLTLTAGGSVEHLDVYPEKLRAVSLEEAQTAVKRHFDPERLVLTAAGTLPG